MSTLAGSVALAFGGATSEILTLLLVTGLVFVGIPTVGMYREANANDNQPYVWSGAMLLASAVVPVLGSIGVWLLYTGVEVTG